MEKKDLILQFILSLAATVVLPATIWIISSSRIFSRLRSFTQDNYEEKVRETIENTIIEKICELLPELFQQYGLTPPQRSASFQTIVRNLLNVSGEPDHLSYLATLYESLVQAGIHSPFFHDIVKAVLSSMGGGG